MPSAPDPVARTVIAFLLLALSPALAAPAAAAPDGIVTRPCACDFPILLARTEAAAQAQDLVVIAAPSASAAAAGRGIAIPGDAVVLVFNNAYAVRLLRADPAAGLEAPLHLHVAEAAGGTATLTYRLPSAVFAPYANPQVDALAHELDGVLARLADAATAAR
jgi:uncharacterized protein (DUF302 family)